MVQCIKKRDGRIVPFDYERIQTAIYKATVAIGDRNEELAKQLCQKVLAQLNADQRDIVEVEQVQNTVEKTLVEAEHYELAKAYILYRNQRTAMREARSSLMRIYDSITDKDATDEDLKRENANIDGNTSMGVMLRYGSEGAKYYNLMSVLKPEYSRAHTSGDIHIHDLDFLTLTTTCCQIDLIRLFQGGFATGVGTLREPGGIAVYGALACIAIQSNQNDQHGGQSVPNFDYAMAGGVRKTFGTLYRSNLCKAALLLCGAETEQTVRQLLSALHDRPDLAGNSLFYVQLRQALSSVCSSEDAERCMQFARTQAEAEADRQTYQAMEAVLHNLNTMQSRAGAQVPFSSLNYGTDTSPEGRMVIRNLLLATEQGLGEGETAIFPIQIFKVKEGVNYNPGDPNYDLFQLACRVSAKRLFPNFSFLDAPYNLQYYKPGHPETEIAYMGCRTRVIGNVHDPDREIIYGRGNLSFTSVNLPRLGVLAEGNTDRFFDSLEEMLELTCGQLIQRFEIQARKKARNYPFLMGQGVWMDSETLKPEDEVRSVLLHGTLSVGFIGLAECLKALMGQHHGESEEAQALGLEIIRYMRAKTDGYSRKTGMNFTLLATPAEGLSGLFVKKDRERFGSLPGITDRDYYTNSFHIPVYFPISAFDKIQKEAPYHALTNAGHITYVEMDGDPSVNLEAFEAVIRLMKESGIGYGSINHPVDRDPCCGYRGVIGDICPKCGRSETAVVSERICRIRPEKKGDL